MRNMEAAATCAPDFPSSSSRGLINQLKFPHYRMRHLTKGPIWPEVLILCWHFYLTPDHMHGQLGSVREGSHGPSRIMNFGTEWNCSGSSDGDDTIPNRQNQPGTFPHREGIPRIFLGQSCWGAVRFNSTLFNGNSSHSLRPATAGRDDGVPKATQRVRQFHSTMFYYIVL